MAVCSNCGSENPAEALFCEKCGKQLTPQQVQQTTQGGAAPPSEPFAERMKETGKKMGEAMDALAQTAGEKAEAVGQRATGWWDERLRIAAPILSGLIGVVIFLVVIIIMDGIANISSHERFWRNLVSFALRYFWLFVGLIFLNSFSEYFYRRYRKRYRWVRPVATAAIVLGWFWIFAQVLEIGGRDLGHPSLTDEGHFIGQVLPLIFVLILVLGYLILAFRVMGERSGRAADWGK